RSSASCGSSIRTQLSPSAPTAGTATPIMSRFPISPPRRSARWAVTTTGDSGCTTPASRPHPPPRPRSGRTGSPRPGGAPPAPPDPAGWPAIPLSAGESARMRWAGDDVGVQWFPWGIWVTEQGEPANALYLILNGTADRLLEQPDSQVTHQRRMQAGDFFGEL